MKMLDLSHYLGAYKIVVDNLSHYWNFVIDT